MAFFAEYLLEQGLIQQEQLVDALVEQIEAQPSVIKVVREMGLLTAQDILRVLKVQAEDQLSFQEAAKKLSLWDQQKGERLFAELSTRRTPLAEILVQRKALDLETLTKAFDAFFSQKEKQVPQANATPLHPEVFDYLNESFLQKLASSVAGISASGAYDSGTWMRLADGLHQIQGAASLYEFHELAEFIKKVEHGLREVLVRDPQKVDSEVVKKMHSAFEGVHSLLSEVVQQHRQGCLSSHFFSDVSHAGKVKIIHDWFTLIEFDLSHLEKRNVA